MIRVNAGLEVGRGVFEKYKGPLFSRTLCFRDPLAYMERETRQHISSRESCQDIYKLNPGGERRGAIINECECRHVLFHCGAFRLRYVVAARAACLPSMTPWHYWVPARLSKRGGWGTASYIRVVSGGA